MGGVDGGKVGNGALEPIHSSVGLGVGGEGMPPVGVCGGLVGNGAPDPIHSSVGLAVVGPECGFLVPKTAVGAMGENIGDVGAVGRSGVSGKGALPPLTTGA